MAINCTDSQNCSSPYCQGYLTCLHQIDEATFNNMVNAYFGSNPPIPVAVNASDLDLSADCSQNYVNCNYDPSNTTENDITVSVANGTGTAGSQFSLSLFNGITAIYSPDTYYFSKASKDGLGLCIIFYATRSQANVYCGDLSEEYP